MATVNATLNGTEHSGTIGGYKINNSYSAYGGYTFNSPVNITSATIYWGAYRSSGSGNSYGDISWEFGNKSGTYSWSSSTNSSTVKTGSFTISCAHSNFSGYFDFDIYTDGDVSSCNLAVTKVEITYTDASVTSYIYYYNGSSLHTSTSKTGTSGSKFTYSLASAPSKTGYTFKGWGTSSSASTTYSAGASRTGYYGTDYEWYANWTPKTYTISYNANGGSNPPSSQTKTHGVTLTLSSTKPKRDGYKFLGWATSSTATSATYSAGGSYTKNAAATLYAVWEILSYDVTFFNSKDGVNIQEPIVESLEYGSQVDLTSSRNFTRSGYKFLGWGKTEDSTDILSEYTVTASNLQSLYSLWELMSNVRVYTDENWQIAIPYIYDGENWKLSISKVFNNEEWRP